MKSREPACVIILYFQKYTGSDCKLITEFHPIDEAVMSLKAFDKDDPDTDNGRLVFRLLDQKGKRKTKLHFVYSPVNSEFLWCKNRGENRK